MTTPKARIAHTAGDWRAAVVGTLSGRWISITADDYRHDDGSPHELFRSETVQTREAGAWRDVDGADVIRANVALVIAGPDLLAALDFCETALALASHTCAEFPDSDKRCEECLGCLNDKGAEMARTAIAKAQAQ